MDKETLSHYGWIVILVLILSVMMALATPFGSFVADGFKAAYAGLWDTNVGAMNIAGIMNLPGEGEEGEPGTGEDSQIPKDGYVIFDRRLKEPRCHTGIGEGTNWDPHNENCYVMEPIKVSWEELMMPETAAIHGYDVKKFTNTQIQNTAFWGGSNPIEVKVPEGIEEIWIQAFYGCSDLVKIELPASLKEIGTEAFRNCYSLETIIFKEGLQTIESSAFNGCYALTNVQLPDSVTTIGSGAFYMNGECDRTQLTSVNIPKGVTVIPSCLFQWDTKMTEVILHDNVKEIGNYAFMGCEYTSFTLPASIEKIGRGPWNSGDLADLYYKGTKAQWAGIIKDPDWAIGGYFKVHCIDGDICRNCKLVVNEDAQWERHSDTLHRKEATCSVCGSLGYIFESHTPVAKEGAVAENHTSSQHKKEAICSVCNDECYEFKSHSMVANEDAEWEYCSTATHMKEATCVCGQTGYVYDSHVGGSATCQDKKLCEVCNEGYGYLVPHKGGAATCTDRAICQWCSNPYGDLIECSGGTATCQTRATCEMCGNLYGDLGAHQSVNGKCTLCGIAATSIESGHLPYEDNVNYAVLGTWDYSDAKSVNITVTYQSEGQYYDWFAISANKDYVSGTYPPNGKYLGSNGVVTYYGGSSAIIGFYGTTKKTVTFENVDMLTGSVIFKSDSGDSRYFGILVHVTPNY